MQQRSILRRASRCADTAKALSCLDYIFHAIILSGSKDEFIPVTLGHGPFEDIYQALIRPRYKVGPRIRLTKFRTALTRPVGNGEITNIKRIICVDPI